MVAQSQLAAVDFNQIQNLEQVKTKDGLGHANVCFSKVTKTWAVKPIKEAKVIIFFSSFIDQTVEAFLKRDLIAVLKIFWRTLPQFLNLTNLMLLHITDQDSAFRLKYPLN